MKTYTEQVFLKPKITSLKEFAGDGSILAIKLFLDDDDDNGLDCQEHGDIRNYNPITKDSVGYLDFGLSPLSYILFYKVCVRVIPAVGN